MLSMLSNGGEFIGNVAYIMWVMKYIGGILRL
jgi:hypothetical protein